MVSWLSRIQTSLPSWIRSPDMSGYMIFNGRLVKEDEISFPEFSRAVLFGDGIFETMRVHQNHIFFRDHHLERCKNGMGILGLKSGTLDLAELDAHINILSEALNISSMRVRLTIFRIGAGFYKPASGGYSWMLQAEEINGPQYKLNTEGLNVGVSSATILCKHQTSECKTISALNYVIAARECEQLGYDDLVINDVNGTPSEAISSNIYFLQGNELLTPDTASGCVKGVIRSVLFNHLTEIGITLRACQITPEIIDRSKSMYLTNTVNGIRWVSEFDGKTYDEGPCLNILNLLNKLR